MITETLHIRSNLPNLGDRVAHNMTLQSESRMESLEPRTPIVHPKTQLRIGNWNVRTLYVQGKTAQAVKAMREANLQIMGISESRWCGSGKFILSTGETSGVLWQRRRSSPTWRGHHAKQRCSKSTD